MADSDFTPQPNPAKAKYPHTRELTILETLCNPSGSSPKPVGVSYVPVNLEPCILLRGKWLRDAGFDIGEKITITVNPNELVITPSAPVPS